jgi:hypothetical protein
MLGLVVALLIPTVILGFRGVKAAQTGTSTVSAMFGITPWKRYATIWVYVVAGITIFYSVLQYFLHRV